MFSRECGKHILLRGDPMGYQVEYPPFARSDGYPKRISRISALTVLFLILFCLLVNSAWPRGAEVLKQLLFSEELVISAAALEDMAQELHSGARLWDAANVFYDKLLQIIR